MPTYTYTARDERGNPVSGTLAAADSEALADQLKRMGYLVTRAREVSSGGAAGQMLRRGGRVGHDDLVLFTVQLSKMVQVGIPLVTALDTIMKQTSQPALRAAVSDVGRAVEGGASFSEALARHPRVFSGLFINMVHAGEVSGRLDDILRRLAVFAKRQAELRQQLMTALTYPLLLLAAGLGAATFLIVGIIPRFMKIFVEAGVPLPLPTRLLFQVSLLVRHGWPVLAVLAAAALIGLAMALRTPAGRRLADAALLRIPVVGELVRQAAVARMARTLATLFASGVPVIEALAIAEQTCGNTVIGEVCRAAQQSVKRGSSIAEPLRASREIPPMVSQMVSVGEATGALDHMLAEIGEHYEELIQHSVKRLTTLIEPAFLVLMGGMVAFIMASILLPLFRMINVIK
jgi:type IV pilus assembly protein PilC